MKKLLIPLLIWCAGMAHAATPYPLGNYNIVYKAVYEPLELPSVSLPTNFGKSVFLSQKDVDLLNEHEIYRIDLVYTQYKTDPEFDQVKLNNDRIKSLEKILPQIHADNPEWRLVEQTGADDRSSASELYHGFKIYYREPNKSYHEYREFFDEYGQKTIKVSLDPSEENTLDYSSGTKIYIPANAIVDENGNLVQGNVEIQYTEYRNPADIALSGIPMKFKDEDELNYNFTSKGMYEIRGYQGDQELHLQKDITVDFNATASVENADFFQLDEKTGEWKKIKVLGNQGQNSVLVNIDDEELGVNKVEIMIDNNPNQPELAWEGKIQTWEKKFGKYGNYKLKTSKVSQDSAVVHMNKPAWKEFMERKNDVTFDTLNWSLIPRKKEVIMPLKESEDFACLVMTGVKKQGAPVFENVDIVNFDPKMAGTMLASGADKGHTYPNLVRGLNSPEFGVYNCDQIYRMGTPVALNPKYTIDGKSIDKADVACVMDLNYNGSFSFAPNSITLNKKGKNAVLLFTSDKKVYIAMPDQMAGLNFSSSTVTIPMEDITDQMKTSDDLKELLQI